MLIEAGQDVATIAVRYPTVPRGPAPTIAKR